MKFTPEQQRHIDGIVERRLAQLRRVHEAEMEVLRAEARQAAELHVMFDERAEPRKPSRAAPTKPGKLLRWRSWLQA
jgi:hypothetical protein